MDGENEDQKIIKLPRGPSKPVNWYSRNRGGGVRHKNFDTASTKYWDHLTGGTLPSGDRDDSGGLDKRDKNK